MTTHNQSASLWLRHISLALAAATLFVPTLQAQSNNAEQALFAYVGTFSSPLRDTLPTQVDLPPGNGRGIHIFRINRDSGAMTPAGIYRMGTSPSSLVVSADGSRLYSANETDRVGNDKQGTVSAFAVDHPSGQLTLLNTVPSGGAGPTYVSIDPSGQNVLVANYFGGSVAVLPILKDGQLGNASDIRVDEGKIGPTTATHAPEGSFAISGHDHTHAHMIQTDASGRFALHADLGLDKIFVWKFDPEKGVLSPNHPASISLPPGDGPRHFHFHPNGRWLYSIQEEGSTIVLFDYDHQAGRLSARQTVSTLPAEFRGSNFCSEILVSADGRFVYAGNRLHDSIGIFSVGDDGELSYVGEEWTRGNYPRSFQFDPSGNFLYCCNQRADHIAVFRVNRQSGSLTFANHYAAVGNPSCIVFLDLAEESK
ncbi:6-phosphogluconolactonase [Rhodopirellula maiorica SM1]|uniref:6-phosphogluconolactonase n=1 Tax=Rhodopirellula maiorica SM1 TaxID=1265738 RepID=M5RVW9_9BACT|nr:lactonase family protein [Rhodopirellula maiorica]EMI18104.1 6-phosphogluconolactonase [Rhodopirellula maiorica SM1]